MGLAQNTMGKGKLRLRKVVCMSNRVAVVSKAFAFWCLMQAPLLVFMQSNNFFHFMPLNQLKEGIIMIMIMIIVMVMNYDYIIFLSHG